MQTKPTTHLIINSCIAILLLCLSCSEKPKNDINQREEKAQISDTLHLNSDLEFLNDLHLINLQSPFKVTSYRLMPLDLNEDQFNALSLGQVYNALDSINRYKLFSGILFNDKIKTQNNWS